MDNAIAAVAFCGSASSLSRAHVCVAYLLYGVVLFLHEQLWHGRPVEPEMSPIRTDPKILVVLFALSSIRHLLIYILRNTCRQAHSLNICVWFFYVCFLVVLAVSNASEWNDSVPR